MLSLQLANVSVLLAFKAEKHTFSPKILFFSMNEVAEKETVKLIDLHSSPRIPDGCMDISPINVKTNKRSRCSPGKIMLMPKDEIMANTFDRVLSFFKGKGELCMANANARDFYKDNPEAVPLDWSGRIIFAGTFFTRNSNDCCLVMPYLEVKEGAVISSGEIPVGSFLMPGDFFAYYYC